MLAGSAGMNVNCVVGVAVHESALAIEPSEPEGLQGERSLGHARCALLFLEVVDEVEVVVAMRSVGGLGVVV